MEADFPGGCTAKICAGIYRTVKERFLAPGMEPDFQVGQEWFLQSTDVCRGDITASLTISHTGVCIR